MKHVQRANGWKRSATRRLLLLLVVAAVLLPACRTQRDALPGVQVGPDLYRDVSTTDTTSLGHLGWRALFTDPQLQALLQEGIANNLDLQVAQARMKQAQANFRQSTMALFPSLSATGQVTRQQQADYQGGINEQIYQLSAASSWEVDLWGKLRGTRRAQLATLMQSEAYQRAVLTQVVAGIASSYYTLLAYDQQLAITERTVANRAQDVGTMKVLKESDVVTGAAVVQSEANRYSAEVTIPDIKRNIRETENALCVLLGRSPGPIVRGTLEAQILPDTLRTGLPAQLLADRPDVQEAEYQVRAAYELVGVARTYFYPTLTITASGGLAATDLDALFDPGSAFANLIGGLTAPIFNQGKNKQRLRVAQAQQEEYLADFRSTVLNAGVEVSNALYAYEAAGQKRELRGQQIDFLQRSVDYTRELLKYTSNTNYTDVLTSEQNLLAAELNGVGDQLQRLLAVVELYRSLGGGVR